MSARYGQTDSQTTTTSLVSYGEEDNPDADETRLAKLAIIEAYFVSGACQSTSSALEPHGIGHMERATVMTMTVNAIRAIARPAMPKPSFHCGRRHGPMPPVERAQNARRLPSCLLDQEE
jgi:hypothetical protein